ncbi:hypothetical protein F5146DRAFT_1053803 [Armillaria mellea]|nr:hypothetical protein F5146DRAFT_1053803 [Armillaria mellea]
MSSLPLFVFFFPVPFKITVFPCLDPTFALVWIPLLLRRGRTPCSLSTALFQAKENNHTTYSSEFGRSTGPVKRRGQCIGRTS